MVNYFDHIFSKKN